MTLRPNRARDLAADATASVTEEYVAAWGPPSVIPVPDAILAAAFVPLSSSSSSAAAAEVSSPSSTLFLGTAHGQIISFEISTLNSSSSGSSSGGGITVKPWRSFYCTPDHSQLLYSPL
jgi:hypothetical protein